MSVGPVRDYTGASAFLNGMPTAGWLLTDRSYDADWFRNALRGKGIKPCIAGRKARKIPIKYCKRRYKRRNRIEIMFGRLKDRCPDAFLSAITLAATMLFWLCVLSPRDTPPFN